MALTTRTNLLQIRDNETFALVPPKSINAYVLTANTPVNVSISALTDAAGIVANALDFSASGNFYLGWNVDNLAVPAANITDGTGPELNPATRKIGAAITKFSLVAPADCVVTMKIFSLTN